jgi:hypothetical protein
MSCCLLLPENDAADATTMAHTSAANHAALAKARLDRVISFFSLTPAMARYCRQCTVIATVQFPLLSPK